MVVNVSLSDMTATFFVLLASVLLLSVRSLGARHTAELKDANKPRLQRRSSETAIRLGKNLSDALPESIIHPYDSRFDESMNSYWLSTAVKILAREYKNEKECQTTTNSQNAGSFAVRSGANTPVARAASIEDGALIDMSLFCEVTLSDEGKGVTIGFGAKRGNVYEELEVKAVALVGGQNSAVGVGGLTLGGGLSFAPRYGFVCSNVLSYELVLSNGSITTASETENPDLFRALKGGGNNFGIVTRFTFPTFPSINIWSGMLYMAKSQTANVLSAFHYSVARANPNGAARSHDPYAACPLACFTYIHLLRINAISVNLVYTSSPRNPKKWPNACDEMNALNPPGRGQVFGTTTIKNDRGTLDDVHVAYADAIPPLKRANKGDANPLGFEDAGDTPLVVVSLTMNWLEQRDDCFVEKMARETIERINRFVKEMGTAHRFRYMNYCCDWQKPFESYGQRNVSFLQDVSRE
ncbi:FAD-binding domain-containing protein [Lentithecium fluviatile CBS 122367]|uniref:FAD-binding domain-containing protein n=1 Tax=Lentithecium fluviatile CBS 122367 TaxID=1168545 RepID=A0A6G1J221_9PLEO|nr:FAD-binding domain-containing protein [Lentithecium fluviatile CBS 122367]